MTYEEARNKARYGRRDWVAFKGRDGEFAFEPFSKDAVKRAMLAVGTSGRFTLLSGGTGVGFNQDWRGGVLLMRNAKHLMARV